MELIKELTQTYRLTPGASNAARRLPVSLLTTSIIDLATAHANMLGFGSEIMAPQGIGWVLSRLTIQMDRWPLADTSYSITTWIESWNRRYSSRCFAVSDESGEIMGYIRTIWMVIDVNTHRGVSTDALNFNPELISSRPCPIPLQEKHITLEHLTENPEHGILSRSSYRFRYTDIDYYRHVNTVKYIELLLNQYTLEEFDASFVHRLEVAFMRESLYGQKATIHKLSVNGAGHKDEFVITVDEHPVLRARVMLMPDSLYPEFTTGENQQ